MQDPPRDSQYIDHERKAKLLRSLEVFCKHFVEDANASKLERHTALMVCCGYDSNLDDSANVGQFDHLGHIALSSGTMFSTYCRDSLSVDTSIDHIGQLQMSRSVWYFLNVEVMQIVSFSPTILQELAPRALP